MTRRLKWSGALRKEWPTYVFTRLGRRDAHGTKVKDVVDSLHGWAEEEFEGQYTTYLMSSSSMAIICIENERDAVRLMLWHDRHTEVSITRLKRQQRNANAY